MSKAMIRAIASWLIVGWISYVFLTSIPYKFTQHPDTQHIFGTIGEWLGGLITPAVGDLFSNFGPYVIGSFEILTCLVLLIPAVIILMRKLKGQPWTNVRPRWHVIGGLMASAVMVGALFFHLFTPLGIEVLHNGVSDGGYLFYAAVSILVLGIVLAIINFTAPAATSTDSW